MVILAPTLTAHLVISLYAAGCVAVRIGVIGRFAGGASSPLAPKYPIPPRLIALAWPALRAFAAVAVLHVLPLYSKRGMYGRDQTAHDMDGMGQRSP